MSHQNCCRYNKLPNLHFSICNADVAKLNDCKISNTRWTIRLVTWLCWIVFGDLPKKTQALCRSKIIISGFQRFSHWERGPGWTVQFSLQDKCHRWSDFIPYSHFCKFGSPLPQPAERWNKEWLTPLQLLTEIWLVQIYRSVVSLPVCFPNFLLPHLIQDILLCWGLPRHRQGRQANDSPQDVTTQLR